MCQIAGFYQPTGTFLNNEEFYHKILSGMKKALDKKALMIRMRTYPIAADWLTRTSPHRAVPSHLTEACITQRN